MFYGQQYGYLPFWHLGPDSEGAAEATWRPRRATRTVTANLENIVVDEMKRTVESLASSCRLVGPGVSLVGSLGFLYVSRDPCSPGKEKRGFDKRRSQPGSIRFMMSSMNGVNHVSMTYVNPEANFS